MAGRGKDSDQLLSLHDVREYLIDTNALKEAESLLTSDDPVEGNDRDAAYKDSKTKALGTAASKGEGRLAYMRKRTQKNKADRREEILDNLTGAGPQGKLNVLREEEEMKELLGIESALREESILLERERMSVAAQAESAKRSNLQQLESQMEQEMLQLELQRNNANKELDKKMSALEGLTSEIQKVEVEMDSQFGPQAMKEREERKKEKESYGNSKKDHMDQMFELVKSHANAVVESQGTKMEAEDELSRLSAAQSNLKDRGASHVDLDTIINTKPLLSGPSSKKDLSKAIPADLVSQLRDTDGLGPEAKKAADVLASMGTTVGLEGQQARLDALKILAQKEGEQYKDGLLSDDAAIPARPPVSNADRVSASSSASEGLMGKDMNLQDSLDAWLNDDKGDTPLSEAAAENKQAVSPLPQTSKPRKASQSPAPAPSKSSKLRAAEFSAPPISSDVFLKEKPKVRESFGSFTANTDTEEGDGAAPKDSLTEELMNEIKRMRQDKEEREQQVNEQLKKQQIQFQQQVQQLQSQMQNPGGMPMAGAPGMMGGYPHPQMDPYTQQFMAQMQMMNQQIERENQMMMQQLGGGAGADPYNQMQPGAQAGGGMGAPAPGAYGNPLRRSGGSVFGGDYDGGLQAFHDRAARDGIVDGELHIPLQRKQMHKAELKYADEIRVLNLEMEKARKQVELDEFRYEADKNRELRKQEDEHSAWLEEQKKELQTLKMKQALAKEQRILNMQLGQLGQAPAPQVGRGGGDEDGAGGQEQAGGGHDMISMEEAGVGALPIPLDLAGGVSALVDGLLMPDPTKLDNLQGSILESITDSSVFRVVVGIYDAAGTCISRLAQSNWQGFKASTVGLQHTLPDVEDGDVIKGNDMQKGRGGSKNIGNDAADWLLMPVKRTLKKSEQELVEGLRLLIEIQFAVNQDSANEPSSLGWGTFPLVGTEMGPGGRGLPPNGQSDPGDLFIRNGFWRVNIRKGLSEATADPTSLPGLDGGYIADDDLPYYTNAFLLLRIGDSIDMQRQYAWKPADHPANLADSSAVHRLYKNPFSDMDDSRNASGKSLPQLPEQQQNQGQGRGQDGQSRPDSSSLKSGTKPFGSASDSGSLNTVVEADNEEDQAAAQDYERKRENIGEAKAKVPWLMGVDPGAATEKYQRGDGVDIYIDGCMYLPDNVTVTRVKAAFFTSEKEPAGPISECYSGLEEVAVSPNYNHKVELRGSSLNLTATCLLRFDTIDSSSQRPSTIGYSCFKVFCTKDREQPESTNSPNVYINTGLFQVPIYGGKVGGKLEVFSEHMLDDNPKIPCASVLIRIKPAPHSKDGLSVLSREDAPEDQWLTLGLSSPAPEYMSGAYYGKLCEPSDLETLCYTAKSASLIISVDSTLNLLLSSAADGEGAPKYQPRPDVQGKKGLKEQKIISEWTQSLLPAHKEMKRVLSYQFISPYSLDCGLNVSIDMLYNMPEAETSFFSKVSPSVYKVIYSIVPPGLFYKDPPMSEGVFYTKSENYDRCYRAPTFTDGFVHMYPTQFDESTYLLIEVRTITVEGAKGGPGTEPVLTVERGNQDKSFWTLLPISSQATSSGEPKYVISGTYQLPLIKGSPPAADLFSSEQSQEPLDLVLERLGPKGAASAQGKKNSLGKALKLMDGASVILRVCNPIFRHLLAFPKNEPHDVSKELHTEVLDAAVSQAERGSTGKSRKPFKYVPALYANPNNNNPSVKENLAKENITDLKKFSKSMNKTFASEVNINMN